MAHQADLGLKSPRRSPDVRTRGAQSVRRALEIARTVAQLQRSGATLARVAKAAELSRSTAFRILRSLTEENFLEFDEADCTYRLGSLAYELGLAADPNKSLVSGHWASAIAALAANTRLTSYLIARSGNEAVCLDCIQGSAAVRAMPMEVGQRVPLGIGAGSLAILASLDDVDVNNILAQHRKRYGQFPVGQLDRDLIFERVHMTRKRGYSVSSGTVAPGVSGVAVLIPSDSSGIQLAMTVSAVSDEICEAEASRLAERIRKEISRRHL